MNVSNSSFTNSMMSQMQQTQQKAQPDASELTSEIIATSDIDGDSLLAIDEVSLSEELFSNMDEDSDGSISSSEIESGLSSMLESMSNQKTSPEEFGQMLSDMGLDVPAAPNSSSTPDVALMASEVFSANDTDVDGLLSLTDIDIPEDIFSSIDADEDGSITEAELAQGLSSLFDSVNSGETSEEEAGEVLSAMGVPPPPAGGGGGASEEDEDDETSSTTVTYDAADTDFDGTVSATEYAEYYSTNSTAASENEMSEYTMDLVSTLIDAVKTEQEENGTDGEIDLSKFKQVMTMVNEQTQDPQTSEMLDKYISQL